MKFSQKAKQAHINEILQYRGWSVERLSANHLRINGSVDVWPTTRKWMRSHHGPNDFASQYNNLGELIGVVRQQCGGAMTPSKFASLPAERKESRSGLIGAAEFARRFGVQPSSPRPVSAISSSNQGRLFDAVATVELPELPIGDPDPNFERPPWKL